MEHHQVYYLLMMAHIEAVKVGKAWRLVPESVIEYDKRHPERTNRETAGYFVYPGDGGFLFGTLPDGLPSNPRRNFAGVEGRRGELVRWPRGHQTVLLKKIKPVSQLELFTA